MSFFKRNKNGPTIPPVASSEPKPDPYASAGPASGGGAAGGRYGGGDPYGVGKSDPYARGAGGAGGDPYARQAGGNPYAQDSPADSARNELFSGYKAPEKPQTERKYGYEGREQEEDFDEDEEIEGIKQEMRGVKQESLASTRWVCTWTRLI